MFQKEAKTSTTIVFLALIALLALGTAIAGQDEKLRQDFRAFGVAMGPGAAGVLEISITRWSTPDERKLLIETLIEKGQEETVKVLRKQPETGFVRTGSGVGRWPSVRLQYAYEFKQENKRRVVLVTDRPIGAAEAIRNNRSMEYDISAIVMELQPQDGKERGQGTLIAAAKINFDKDKKQLEVESRGVVPVRLTDIRREK